ncbi:CocE/NonD family hydrolase [Acidobacteriota bacterium]
MEIGRNCEGFVASIKMKKSCAHTWVKVFIFSFVLIGALNGESKPKYEVRVEKSIMVAMRDGVKLSTDLYFPVGVSKKLPVILIRLPYDKDKYYQRTWGTEAYDFAALGYIVAVQDARGKFESEGVFRVQAEQEAEDGYDAVTWAATQPWSDGNVGTYGCSYLGECQIQQAKLRNPHLKAMIPKAAGGAIGTAGNKYSFFGFFCGGVFELSPALGWFFDSGSKVYFRPPPGITRETFLQIDKFFNPAPVLPDMDYQAIWRSLPVIDMMKKAGAPPTDFEEYASHEPGDPWWDQYAYIKDTDTFDVPALHVDSWYNGCIDETLYLFNLFQRNAVSERCRDNQFVIVSPTSHCRSERATEQTIVGERTVGDARLDYWGIYVKWFDYWLKGIDNRITNMPKVQIYIMGENKWRSENEWPLARTQYTKYYLHSDGYANSRFGTGTLGTKLPSSEPADRYVYDPKTPVPSAGGPICCTGTADAPPGAFDQAEVEIRHDVLVYNTPLLQEGIEVTGQLEVVLYVSSSARDTDFTAKLVDVYPDGTAYNIQDGIIRARYREGFRNKVWMRPGEVYEVKINLFATSNYFGPGHRIRLEVSSSNFPRFVRNLNTGGNNFDETEWDVAKNSIHHSKKYPSHIILPIIK